LILIRARFIRRFQARASRRNASRSGFFGYGGINAQTVPDFAADLRSGVPNERNYQGLSSTAAK
jgi:hypothetical protein